MNYIWDKIIYYLIPVFVATYIVAILTALTLFIIYLVIK